MPEQMELLQILQREDPRDQEKVERFIKESLDYKLGIIYKLLLKNERSLARLMRASRKDQNLHIQARADVKLEVETSSTRGRESSH